MLIHIDPDIFQKCVAGRLKKQIFTHSPPKFKYTEHVQVDFYPQPIWRSALKSQASTQSILEGLIYKSSAPLQTSH